MTHCLLSLDLPNADETDRRTFYRLMDANDWVKFDNVDTTWCKLVELVYPASIHNRVMDNLEEAAREARLAQVCYVVQIGDHAAFSGQILKKDGIYLRNKV